MKVKFLLLFAVLTIIFTSCQNTDEPKEISKPGTNGNYRIEIVGKQADQQDSRSSGIIQFEGGTASGAGLYDSKDKANVSATPDDGYEIDYFYGGPESEPKKYDNAKSGASIFDVSIDGQDHLFHVGFKKKERTLTINAGSGGSVTPSGKDTYQVNKPITITATAKSGYKFAGWEINEGDVTIADKNNATTTATLNNLNSTITAKFSASFPVTDYIFLGYEGEYSKTAIIYTGNNIHTFNVTQWSDIAYGNGKYIVVGSSKKGGCISTSTDGDNWSEPSFFNDVYGFQSVTFGNGKFLVIGSDGYITTSTDGITWSKPAKKIAFSYESAAYGNSAWVAVGSEGYINTSTDDCANWYNYAYKQDGPTETVYDVVFANNYFTVVGIQAFVWYSKDGITWNRQEISTGKNYSICYGNNKYVAVGAKGNILTSTQYNFAGCTLKQVGNEDFRFVKYYNGKYIAVGKTGNISSSSDGNSWSQPSNIINNTEISGITGFINKIK